MSWNDNYENGENSYTNYNNSENTSYESNNSSEENNHDDNLDDTLLAEALGDSQVDHSEESVESSDESSDEATPSNDEDMNIQSVLDKIDAEIQRAPNNTKSDKEFSAKDIYKIFNVHAVLSNFGEEVSEEVASTLGIGTKAKPIRRYIDIAEMDKQEFDSRTYSMSILRAIYEVDHTSGEGKDPVATTIAAMNMLSVLNPDEKFAVISLVRSLLKSINSDTVVRSTRTSSAPEIFSEIRNVLNENEGISQRVTVLDTALSTIRDKAL